MVSYKRNHKPGAELFWNKSMFQHHVEQECKTYQDVEGRKVEVLCRDTVFIATFAIFHSTQSIDDVVSGNI